MGNKKSIFEKFKEKLIEEIDEESEGNSEEQVEVEEVYLKEIQAKEIEIKKDHNPGSFEMDHFFSIKDIYSRWELSQSEMNTIYIAERFSEALPQNLPTDVKKQSVLNIVEASGMNVKTLLADGNERLEVLNTFMKSFSEQTEEVIYKNEQEIEGLIRKINEYKGIINERKKLQEEQKSVLEYEREKIFNIIQFINPTK